MASLTPILLDAKKEYTHQLADVMLPYVMRTVSALYDQAKHKTKQFRVLLQQVPSWNDQVIREKTADIERKYSQLQNLITACCVSYTKVLGSIRLNTTQQSNIRLSIPETHAFVHGVYVYVAKEFFYEPQLVYSTRAAKNDLMREAVEESVRQNVPIDQLLEAYLTTSVDGQGIDPIAASADLDHTAFPSLDDPQPPPSSPQAFMTDPQGYATDPVDPQGFAADPEYPSQPQEAFVDPQTAAEPSQPHESFANPPSQPFPSVPQPPSQPFPPVPQPPPPAAPAAPAADEYMPIQIQQDEMFGSDDERKTDVDFM